MSTALPLTALPAQCLNYNKSLFHKTCTHLNLFREKQGIERNVIASVIQNLGRKLSNSNVALEGGIPLFHMIHTRRLDKTNMLSQSSDSTFQLKHTYVLCSILTYIFSFFFPSPNSLISVNVPLVAASSGLQPLTFSLGFHQQLHHRDFWLTFLFFPSLKNFHCLLGHNEKFLKQHM